MSSALLLETALSPENTTTVCVEWASVVAVVLCVAVVAVVLSVVMVAALLVCLVLDIHPAISVASCLLFCGCK
jgi:xanthine/uracil/vitamin C permease (AzgA family)